MHKRSLTRTIVVIICIVFIFCAGCFSTKEITPVPVTQTSVPNETHSVVVTPVTTPPVRSEVTAVGTFQSRDEIVYRNGTSARDAEFEVLFAKSSGEIINKTGLVLEAMIPGSVSVQLVYSPAVLYLRAEDLGFTIEDTYNQMLKTNTTSPENEARRIAYIQFLYSARNAAYHIADAAEAESFGDYQNALAYLQTAKGDLRSIKVNPALPPTSPYNTLNVFLSEYIGRMQDKVVQQQNLELNKRPQTEDRFARLP
jgi:hypothetical protein